LLNKYWNSPALALTVRPSGIKRSLCITLGLGLSLSVYLVSAGGHLAVAVAMILPAAYFLRRLYREPLCGATLGWRQGQWIIFFRGQIIAVELCSGWVCLPWIIYLQLRDPGTRCCYPLVLFPDSAEEEDLRRLSRRLLLER
jgi:hypothetical protein